MFQSKRKTPCWKPGLPFPTPPPPSSLKDSLKERYRARSLGYTQIGVGRETEALVLKPRSLPFCNSGGFPRGPGGGGDPGERPLFLSGQFWDGERNIGPPRKSWPQSWLSPEEQPQPYLSPLQTGSVPPAPTWHQDLESSISSG